MNKQEIALTIIAVILFITVVVLIGIVIHYKTKHDEACSAWTFEVDKKNKKIEALQELIDNLQDSITFLEEKLKEPEKVIKIEKVVMSPKEITCKFEISNRLTLVDADCLKRHAFDALADYIIKEYDNNPTLFNIQWKQDPINFSTHFRLNVRLLPYPEESDTFETICKEMEE